MIDDLIGEINRILSLLVCPGFCQKQQEKLFFSSYFMNNKKIKNPYFSKFYKLFESIKFTRIFSCSALSVIPALRATSAALLNLPAFS